LCNDVQANSRRAVAGGPDGRYLQKLGINILIVDDEEPLRRFVDRVLSGAGYTTAKASDGPGALQTAPTLGAIDVLVTDLVMPGMTGDELARRMRQDEPGLKVLYLTGYSDRLFKQKTLLWEGEAFLDKPCSVRGLLEAVSLLVFGRVDTPRARIEASRVSSPP
jgi:CheY-like chemotaxis protein